MKKFKKCPKLTYHVHSNGFFNRDREVVVCCKAPEPKKQQHKKVNNRLI